MPFGDGYQANPLQRNAEAVLDGERLDVEMKQSRNAEWAATGKPYGAVRFYSTDTTSN